MNVISFVTQKGGTGKSTLALNLAVAAEGQGEKVCVLDLDPQGTSASWYDVRTAESPSVVPGDKVENLGDALAKLESAGFTLTIIDTAGVDSHATRGAMQVADLCLMPVRPSEADLKASTVTVKALSDMGKEFAFVLNQAPAAKQARLMGAVRTRLAAAAPVVPVPIATRIDHQYAYALGQGVTEFAPSGKAAAEIKELWAWCHKKIGKNADEQTKRRA